MGTGFLKIPDSVIYLGEHSVSTREEEDTEKLLEFWPISFEGLGNEADAHRKNSNLHFYILYSLEIILKKR